MQRRKDRDDEPSERDQSQQLLEEDGEGQENQEENADSEENKKKPAAGVIPKEEDKSVAARGKKFLKAISAGGVENGIYFKKNKQYFSLVTGCISMIGLVVILTATFMIYRDIINEEVINPTVEYPKNNVGFYNVKF